mgnify:CR=1 FL=1
MSLFSDDEDMFRKCIIFYMTISARKLNKTFDTSAIDSLVFSKIKSDLFPVLAVRDKFDLEGKKQQAKDYIATIMRPAEKEMEYMDRFEAKDYKPELLFEDAKFWNEFVIIQWLCGNVNKYVKQLGRDLSSGFKKRLRIIKTFRNSPVCAMGLLMLPLLKLFRDFKSIG